MRYLAFSLLAGGAAATMYGENSGWSMSQSEPPSQVSSGSAVTQTVIVGGVAGLVYTPSSITANVGDMVEFQFMMKNHTVTQSTFDEPCVKMANGVDSGFMPNPNNTMPPPIFMHKVMDTSPQWFYCRQKEGVHCGKGMVFSINANQNKTFNQYKQNALNINGTQASFTSVNIQAASPPPSVASTVTINANQASSTGSAQNNNQQGSVIQGNGQMVNGQFQCTCLCGTNQLSAGVGVGSFGGVGGSLPTMWGAVQQAAVANNGSCGA